MKILIAEDNPIIQMLYKHIFTKFSVHFKIVDNGYHLLDYLEKNMIYDLIILDIHMPKMDGFQTIKEIRKKPYTRYLPVLAVTADEYFYESEHFELGLFDDYLTKPFKTSDLLHKLTQLSKEFSLSNPFKAKSG